MKPVWAAIAGVGAVLGTTAALALGAAARETYLPGAEVEKILVDGSVWGGAIDTRRPGCALAQCGDASGTFAFEKKSGGGLTVRVYFRAGKDGFDAHKAGQRFAGDIREGSEGPAVPVTIKSNGQVVFQARNKWGCRFQGTVGICVRESRGDGYRDKFQMVRLPD